LGDWHGTLGGAFRNESLNARNAFAPLHSPEQYRRFGFDIGGPLWRNHTSLFFSAEGANFYDSKTIVAALPEGPFNDIIRKPSRFLNTSARVEHLLTKSHTLRFQYQRSGWRDDNLGVGDYDLPDRAYSTETVENFLRVSDSGPLTPHIVNEFRFQARWQSLKSNAASDSPAILVLNAFNRGSSQIQSDRRIRTFELEDGADFVFGQHSMKAEVRFEAGNYDTSELQNANGTFTFSSLDAFSAGRPTTYTRRIGDPSVSFAQYHFGWFVQDDIRVRKNLSLSLGLRHEIQSHLDVHMNFAPRGGISWSPFADGKTTFRAGAGIFYDWFTPLLYEQTLRVDGQRQRNIVVLNPGFPDPLIGGT
jgi:hypothetical protein